VTATTRSSVTVQFTSTSTTTCTLLTLIQLSCDRRSSRAAAISCNCRRLHRTCRPLSTRCPADVGRSNGRMSRCDGSGRSVSGARQPARSTSLARQMSSLNLIIRSYSVLLTAMHRVQVTYSRPTVIVELTRFLNEQATETA